MSDRRNFLKSLLGFSLIPRFGAGRAAKAASPLIESEPFKLMKAAAHRRILTPVMQVGFTADEQFTEAHGVQMASDELCDWLHDKSEAIESPSVACGGFEYVELKPKDSIDIAKFTTPRDDKSHLSKAYRDAPVDEPAVTVLPPVDPYEDVDLNLLETSFWSANPDLKPRTLDGVDVYINEDGTIVCNNQTISDVVKGSHELQRDRSRKQQECLSHVSKINPDLNPSDLEGVDEYVNDSEELRKRIRGISSNVTIIDYEPIVDSDVMDLVIHGFGFTKDRVDGVVGGVLSGVPEVIVSSPYADEVGLCTVPVTQDLIDDHAPLRRVLNDIMDEQAKASLLEFDGEASEPAYDQASETFSYVVDQAVNLTPDDRPPCSKT